MSNLPEMLNTTDETPSDSRALANLEDMRDRVGAGARAALEQAQSIRRRAEALAPPAAFTGAALDASSQALVRHRHLRFHAEKPSGTLQQEPGYVQPSMTYALPFGGSAGEARPEPSSAPTERHSGSPKTATSASSPDAARRGIDAQAIGERVYELMAQELRTTRARTSGR